MQTIANASSGLILLACLCYLATVILAVPLGIPGIVSEEWSLLPLSAGAILLGLGMLGEAAAD